jgi:UDPglucose--hexose-1-phosphate uridylyltransferase
MSELRQNILTENWAVIAPERGKRPEVTKRTGSGDIRDGAEYSETCPFCPGNEERFGTIALNEIAGADGDWQVRVIENKFKIFDGFESCPPKPEPFHRHGVYSHYQGCGDHYLFVEHRTHNRIMGEMTVSEIRNVFEGYGRVMARFRENPNNMISVAFKNQGPSAGGSQPHPHSQIVGSRIVPARIRNALHVQERYFDVNGDCAMCALLRYEEESAERVVARTDHALVLSPYAAASPYEMWVVPTRHAACFSELDAAELMELASGVGLVLGAYASELANPDFNYFIHSAPNALSHVPYYHVYFQIVPRMGTTGGFEMGTDIPVNSVPPEEATGIFGRAVPGSLKE